MGKRREHSKEFLLLTDQCFHNRIRNGQLGEFETVMASPEAHRLIVEAIVGSARDPILNSLYWYVNALSHRYVQGKQFTEQDRREIEQKTLESVWMFASAESRLSDPIRDICGLVRQILKNKLNDHFRKISHENYFIRELRKYINDVGTRYGANGLDYPQSDEIVYVQVERAIEMLLPEEQVLLGQFIQFEGNIRRMASHREEPDHVTRYAFRKACKKLREIL